jgi:hypothetical protein
MKLILITLTLGLALVVGVVAQTNTNKVYEITASGGGPPKTFDDGTNWIVKTEVEVGTNWEGFWLTNLDLYQFGKSGFSNTWVMSKWKTNVFSNLLEHVEYTIPKPLPTRVVTAIIQTNKDGSYKLIGFKP